VREEFFFCNAGDRTVERIEKEGKRTVLADRFEGKKFNAPNDLIVKADGAIYFTGSRIDTTRPDNDPEKGEPSSGVYLIRDGKLQLLVHDLITPNGLAFTVDEKHLYVQECLFDGPGGVWILSPEGKHIGTILAPGTPYQSHFWRRRLQDSLHYVLHELVPYPAKGCWPTPVGNHLERFFDCPQASREASVAYWGENTSSTFPGVPP
jgi:hypothetical protein